MALKANRDPNYYTKYESITNCGSYAFNIVEWYTPDEVFDLDDEELANRLFDEGMNEYDIIDLLFDRDVRQIMEDFDNELLLTYDMNYPLKDNEELIAFRVCVNPYSSDGMMTDYHFRVKRNGKWMEKCGQEPVHEIENYNEDSWELSDDLIYEGPIAYFVKKVA